MMIRGVEMMVEEGEYDSSTCGLCVCCVYVCVCVRACVRACVRVCVCEKECGCMLYRNVLVTPCTPVIDYQVFYLRWLNPWILLRMS